MKKSEEGGESLEMSLKGHGGRDDENEPERPGVEVGLTWAQARASSKRNRLSPPMDCPAWLCCLLPCLLSTKKMRRFQHAIGDEAALVLRDGEWTDLDSSDVVVNDVVKLRPGDVAPADAKIIRATQNFRISNEALTGDASAISASAGDRVPLAARVLDGDAKLIVVAIGDDTELARRMSVNFFFPILFTFTGERATGHRPETTNNYYNNAGGNNNLLLLHGKSLATAESEPHVIYEIRV